MTEAVKKDGLYWKHDLVAKAAFITRENIDNLLSDSGFNGEIGLLSIDLDGNDYWVWEAIQTVRPIIHMRVQRRFWGCLPNIHPV